MGRKHSREQGLGTDLGLSGLSGMFRGLGSFVDLISKLTDEGGGELVRSGTVGDEKKGVKAVYGFSVRVGGGGKPVIEPFGNVKGDGLGALVEQAREPIVDVFDEGDQLVVVAELPGVDANDIRFEVKEDVLDITATRGECKYQKEVLLAAPVLTESATSSYRNGVFELKLPKSK